MARSVAPSQSCSSRFRCGYAYAMLMLRFRTGGLGRIVSEEADDLPGDFDGVPVDDIDLRAVERHASRANTHRRPRLAAPKQPTQHATLR
jgi:hypothetical protein